MSKKDTAKKADKNESRQKEIKQSIEKFGKEMNAGVSAIGRAAKIYVDAVKKNGTDAEAQFRGAFPSVTETTWDKLRRIGHGDLPPNALLLTGPVYKRVERMGPKEREKFFKNDIGVEVYNPQTRTAETVPYGKIAPRHERILYKPNGEKRTLAEQIAFIKAEAGQVAPARPQCAWFVKNDTLVVNRACCIGKKELEAILAEME